MSTGLQHIFYGEIEKIIPELSSKLKAPWLNLLKKTLKNIEVSWNGM